MIPFVSVDDVKTRMALSSSIQGVEPIILSGLKAAYQYVGSRLNSVFEQATYSDLFYLDETMAGGITPNGFWKLRLSTGFVDTSQALVVTKADTPDMFNSLVVPNFYKLDAEKGVLSLPRDVPSTWRRVSFTSNPNGVTSGQYVMVTYKAGFSVTTASNGVTTITPTAPDWLSEALLAYVPAVFQFQQPTNQEGSAGVLAESSMEHVNALLDIHGRTGMGFYLNPVY